MAYINQEEKKEIAAVVAPILKKYGVKGTLSIENHSTLVLTISKGSIDFIQNYNDIVSERAAYRNDQFQPAENYLDVNVYWFDKHFTGIAKEFLAEIIPVLKGKNWFDKSDIQSDYFHVKHYFSIKIGKWNKPYQLSN
jgi:hypothetical protein